MWLILETNLPMFVYAFQCLWRHRLLKEFSVLVGIRDADTFVSIYLVYNNINNSKEYFTI